MPELALISIPPFTITGQIHLLPERDLHEALDELIGPVRPGDRGDLLVGPVGEARTTALIVAVNHSRAQILAPHREVDPWAGLDRSAAPARRRAGTAPPADRRRPRPEPGPRRRRRAGDAPRLARARDARLADRAS